MKNLRGNCYVTTEALYHILGEKESGWNVMRILNCQGDTHYYLEHDLGIIMDPTRLQFLTLPDYSLGRRTGFLTRRPSKRALKLMEILTWQNKNETS